MQSSTQDLSDLFCTHRHTNTHIHTHINIHINASTHTQSTCTLEILNTSCAVGLLYYAAWYCRHVCSSMTSSNLIYAQGFSIPSIDIPDVELMNSPLCNNLVKALVLEGQRWREKYAVGLASPSSPNPPTPSSNSLLLSDNLLPTPTPSQLICHLHSSLQDNNNEPKESTSKVWTDSASCIFSQIICCVYSCWQEITHFTCPWLFSIRPFFFFFCISGLIHVSHLPKSTLQAASVDVFLATWRQWEKLKTPHLKYHRLQKPVGKQSLVYTFSRQGDKYTTNKIV